jgi:TatD DNase family protein
MFVDTHAHLFYPDFAPDWDAMLGRALADGVERFVVVGTDATTSRAAIELCRGRARFHPTAGVHPHEAAGFDAATRATIEEMCRLPEVVGVGESGLDWFKEFSPRAAQLEAFRWHCDLSRELDKALVVHCRDAFEECFAAIEASGARRGVFHCFTGGVDEARRALELGFHVSFSGVVTYPKNEALRAAARCVPADRLLLETDCPYLPPQGARGRRNEPALLLRTAECVAKERGTSLLDLARSSTSAACALFGLE